MSFLSGEGILTKKIVSFDGFKEKMIGSGWNWLEEDQTFVHTKTLAVFDPFHESQWQMKKYGHLEAWRFFAELNLIPTEAPF